MVKIDKLSVIQEESVFWIFLSADNSTYRFPVSEFLAQQIHSILGLKESVLTQIMGALHVSHKRCVIKDRETAILEIDNQIYMASVEEILPLALDVQAEIYVDHACMQHDYVYDPAHEAEVARMREQEEYDYREQRICELLKDIEKAVQTEQYEHAAFLRDQISSLEKQRKDFRDNKENQN